MTVVIVVGTPLAARADWGQFQGAGTHNGLTDGPSAPLAVAWTNEDVELEGADATGGLSSPVIAEDGTIVVVAPTAVLGFDGEDGSEVFSAERDLGPSSQPAIGEGAEGPIVVYTEGFGAVGPASTASVGASPSPSPSPSGTESEEDGEFDSHVNAVDLTTGAPVWDRPVSLEDVVLAPVAVDEEAAYVGDYGGGVTAIDLGSGAVRWFAQLGSPVSGAVTVEGDRALVTLLGGTDAPSVVVALDLGDGEELWRTSGGDVSNLVSAPVVAEGRIFVTDALGGIVAFDDDDGHLLWRTEFTNPLTNRLVVVQDVGGAAPVSAEGQVFVVDVTGRVYAVTAETGAELWDHALNDPAPAAAPLLTEDHVLIPTDSGAVSAVDRETGHLVSRTEDQGSFLRGLADAGDLLVGVTGFDDAGIVAFEADPDGALIDEPSPTTFDLGGVLVGFLAGVIPLGVAAMALTRPLNRRLRPVTPLVDGAEDEG
jgi:outer membrane protein assembly factor BamB